MTAVDGAAGFGAKVIAAAEYEHEVCTVNEPVCCVVVAPSHNT